MANYKNKVFFKNSDNMVELPDESINLVVTSPPYFNIKDYSKDGYQEETVADKKDGQIGDINSYSTFINSMIPIWKECLRVLKPNGKMVINTPLMPMIKKEYSTHYNRHIFNINSDIEHSIIDNIPEFYLMDLYIWNRTNSTKNLMFGSYPYPRNFYAQNTVEFINVFVKAGTPTDKVSKEIKQNSKLTQEQWTEYTKQVWNIPIPSKKDDSWGEHSAIMPEEIVERCIKLYSFVDDVILDPFTGSGTTLKVAKEFDRSYVGYEIAKEYETVINSKIKSLELTRDVWEWDYLENSLPTVDKVDEKQDKILDVCEDDLYRNSG
jgi:site-specific DNA-methyltransferase (cytosine-N4-specific)